jgi:UDP-N-acetylmuramate dehydrogenase
MNSVTAAADYIAAAMPELECRRFEPLSAHTSFHIGGSVTAMYLPETPDALERLLAALSECKITPIIIGNGTNILADGRGFDAIAIKTSGIIRVESTPDGLIRAGAGASLRRVAEFARRNCLRGLEFAHGIPGTLGGAIVMNAGAYGGRMSDAVAAVRTLPGGEDITADACGFGYRSSRFEGSGEVIASADLALGGGDADDITAAVEEYAARRRAAQPLNLPSAGSAFRRPSGGYAADLIDRAGLKGYSVGGARVSEKHAGFIVNAGSASFDDVLRVMEHVRARVAELFGIELDPEIKILRRGEDGGATQWKF